MIPGSRITAVQRQIGDTRISQVFGILFRQLLCFRMLLVAQLKFLPEFCVRHPTDPWNRGLNWSSNKAMLLRRLQVEQ